MSTAAETIAPGVTERGDVRQLLAGGIGNALEWYDFAAYGYFAGTFGRNFFPGHDPVVSLAAAFGVFAAAFLMRPLGGALFGHVGDRIGRKRAMLLSAGLMTVATVVIGLLPTYATIGYAAPLLLTGLRLLQGLSVGGEFATSIVFLVERSTPRHRGILGSFAPMGVCTGTLLGSGVGVTVASLLDPAALDAWGWRVPFLLGIVLGGAALVLRRTMANDARPAGRQHEDQPLVAAFRTDWRNMLRAITASASGAASFYMIFVYLVTFMQTVDHLPVARALQINTVSMAVQLLMVPLFAWLSDRVGRRFVLVGSTIGILLFAWPLFRLMARPEGVMVLLGQLGFAVLIGAFAGPMPAMLVELFRSPTRCTAVAVSYNTAFAVLGGTAPVAAVWLVGREHLAVGPAFYLMVLAIISLVGVLAIPDRTAQPLRD